jgi:type IV pilus assembly protein PilP
MQKNSRSLLPLALLFSFSVMAASAAPAPAPTQTAPPPSGQVPVAGAASKPGAPAKTEAAASLNQNDPNVQAPSPFNIFSGMMDPFDYDPRGRRDPFGQPIPDKPLSQGLVHGPLLPLQRFELSQLRLTAILWDVRSPKAMLRDPGGIVYVVTPNSKIGPRNGYVAAIREGEIVVVETIEQDGRLVSTAQVVKIAK